VLLAGHVKMCATTMSSVDFRGVVAETPSELGVHDIFTLMAVEHNHHCLMNLEPGATWTMQIAKFLASVCKATSSTPWWNALRCPNLPQFGCLLNCGGHSGKTHRMQCFEVPFLGWTRGPEHLPNQLAAFSCKIHLRGRCQKKKEEKILLIAPSISFLHSSVVLW